MNLTEIKTETLIDSFPQNNPLYKDSGLWQVRSDDMEDIIFQQTADETFREFIIRYSKHLESDPYFITELASKQFKI